jgi:hypothetical protein
MDAVGDSINWSEVARPAIASAVATYEQRKTKTMDTIVERLRASKQEAYSEDKTQGHEHGRTWAEEGAEYRDLQRLDKAWARSGSDGSPLDVLMHAIDADDLTPEERLNYLFDDERFDASDEYYESFIEGALELFHKVKNKL